MSTCQSLSAIPRPPGRFVQVPLAILTDERLAPGAKLFLAHLLRWDWGAGCWLTDKQLARELAVTERTIRNHTRALDEAGHLWVFEDREGMTVRLVVRPGHLYPRPPGISRPTPQKSFSRPEPPCKVLKHGLEVHALPTGFEVDRNTLPPNPSPGLAAVGKGEELSLTGENPSVEIPEICQKSEAMLAPDAALTGFAERAPDLETSEVCSSPEFSASSALADELVGIGVTQPVAEALAHKASPGRIRAALRYVSGYRGEVLNPPGLLRHLLETPARLPGWCYPADLRRSKTPIETRSPGGSDFDPPSGVDRDQRRAASPHAELWGRVSARLEGMMQRQSFKTWFVPAFIDRIEAGAVVLNAPSHFFADWIEEHYTETVIEALRAEGVDVERVEVEV